MLTIKNKDKIRTLFITKGWMVENIEETNSYNPQNGKIQLYYLITIRNMVTKYFEEVKLYRVKGYLNRNWYELSCTRKGKVHTQYLAKEGIQNKKILLQHIKIVGID
jgi:hypothetical protein